MKKPGPLLVRPARLPNEACDVENCHGDPVSEVHVLSSWWRLCGEHTVRVRVELDAALLIAAKRGRYP